MPGINTCHISWKNGISYDGCAETIVFPFGLFFMNIPLTAESHLIQKYVAMKTK
ncbi:hypothetical protein AERO9A_420011 [Aeromonas salmonicida]|nr:hypothetical protein AERO9A_420011 [Aeromonas salmonicida]